MALTQEQKDGILTDLASGLRLSAIIRNRSLSRQDVWTWRNDNLATVLPATFQGMEGTGTKAERLAILNGIRDGINVQLTAIDARIATVEAE